MDRLLYETVLKGDLVAFHKLIQENETLIKQTVPGSLNTVLHLAARFGQLRLASETLSLCPEMVTAENADLETPLHEACREGQTEVMKVLIERDEGVVYKVNRREESAMFVACERGRVQVVKHLLRFPWLLMLEVDSLTCSIHVAAAAGYTEIVKDILKERPEFAQKRNAHGCTPLHLACSKGHLGVTRELLRLEPDLSFAQDHEGRTPLHWASMKGKVNIIDEIISTSLEPVEMVTSHGETILHLAVRNNQFDALKFLVEMLDVTKLVNVKDNDGNTVLHLATSGKLTTMVIYLLKLGIDVNAINRKGYTALDVVESDASNSGALAIVPALQEAGAKRCDQLPPKPRDITETSFITTIPSPQTKKHLLPNSPAKIQARRRAKQIELQNEGLRNARNTITVVAVLIATVAFTAGINPPGGFDQRSGKAMLGRKTPFKVFVVFNVMALFLSLGIVNVLVSVIPFRRKSMMKLLEATHKVMWVSTVFMVSAYVSATWAILPRDSGSVWLVAVLVSFGVGCTVVVFLVLTVLLAKQLSRKREWRRRKEKKGKDGSPNGSVNSHVGEMHFVRNSGEASSNSDVDSSDHGYHVY